MEKLADGYGLIEGPVYDPARGLIYSDVINGGVFCLSDGGDIELIVPHRRGIGGMALHERGGLIVSGRNIGYKPPDGGETMVLLGNDVEPNIVGFNDLTTDAAGRIYVGSLGYSPVGNDDLPGPEQTGFLHMIDLDGSARTMASGITLTNGLGFSPDGKTLYHSDSRVHTIWQYDIAADGGAGNQRPFAKVDGGIPDGLAVAEDGRVWVAIAHGSTVRVYGPDGAEEARIDCPLPMVTSVCFGGADLRDLYIVTGARGADREDAGSIFKRRVDVPGLPVVPARVPVG